MYVPTAYIAYFWRVKFKLEIETNTSLNTMQINVAIDGYDMYANIYLHSDGDTIWKFQMLSNINLRLGPETLFRRAKVKVKHLTNWLHQFGQYGYVYLVRLIQVRLDDLNKYLIGTI
jgi:hypothetical protein